jgi:hypothetical protein
MDQARSEEHDHARDPSPENHDNGSMARGEAVRGVDTGRSYTSHRNKGEEASSESGEDGGEALVCWVK